jgi:uncharacterized protein
MIKRSLSVGVLSAAIRLYQIVLSPLLGPRCRYWPSCSNYVGEAVRLHGFVAGLRLGVARLLRCHPWGGSGFDPVPDCCTEHHATATPRRWPVALRDANAADPEHTV